MQTEQGRFRRGGADQQSEKGVPSDAARKRAAVELIRREERTLKRTARRYSVCDDDAEDVYQRSLEILLTKAPTDDQRQLIKWMQTVTKHEALAVRRQRERLLGRPPSGTDDTTGDWMELLPHRGDGPAEIAERHEQIARCREALQALKPHELQALTLLAEGFSYAEIGDRTGWSYTKVRAKKVFDVESAVVITQKFHMARSLYLADAAGLNATGLTSNLHSYGFKGQQADVREVLARVKAIGEAALDSDVLLGPEIPITGDGRESWGPAPPPGTPPAGAPRS